MNHMKQILCLSLCMLLIGAVAMYADQLAGWVVDKPCAELNQLQGMDHKKHVEEGKPAVFVNEATKKIMAIANPEKVMDFIGEKVTITAKVRDDDSLEIQQIKTARTTGDD